MVGNRAIVPRHLCKIGPGYELCVEWGSTNTAGTSMFKISHIKCEVKT